MTPDAVRERLYALVSSLSGVPVSRLTANTRLLQDMGIDGDDARELMCAFSTEFSVDLAGLSFGKYFNAEPSLADPLWFLPWRRKKRMARQALTLDHLVEVATVGHWEESS